MCLTKLLSNKLSLNCQLARKLSTDHAVLASSVRVEKNLKALLMKTTNNIGEGVVKKILGLINKSLDANYCIEQEWEIWVTERS